ncbi:MAG TPA: hypothetical protein VK110_03620, partial [Salinisphaeraceae bacterium]|nr:hypothetical protein [Salinisphaeraceae bacterium]
MMQPESPPQADMPPENLHPNWQADDHLLAVLAANARDHGRDIAMRERDRGIWQEYSWQDFLDNVLAAA